MSKDALLERVNKVLGKDYTYKTHYKTIEDLCTKIEQQRSRIRVEGQMLNDCQIRLDALENWAMPALKDELLKAHEQIKRQQQEYATLSESIGEADVMIQELQEEVMQYKLQESLLLERLKKAEQHSRFLKFMAMAEENLKLAEENARLKELVHV